MSITAPSRADAGVAIDPTLVEALARESGEAEQEVERILREEVQRLAAQARINTFVTVLATSSVRTRLRHQTARPH
ncbi:MAG TPA: DUF3562 domain-containing protein [Steroidobacteraceae bacterium]|nr:DUF3562 domain-containing protein [Steroidobacteraceae bacterium]